jgi:formylglycine-generating enzyme required for sulfatase activity
MRCRVFSQAETGSKWREDAAMPEPIHVPSPDHFPPRLAELGYRVVYLDSAEVTLPPLCDVPTGSFLMGSDPAEDKNALPDEQPQHWVTLPAFQIARYPVTVAEFACFVRAGQRRPTNWRAQLGKLDHPVVNVSWHDAVAYAAWLTELSGQLWRLPSEAEWEKAARWDPTTRIAYLYPWGDTFDASRCNTNDGDKRGSTPAGTYADRNDASPCGAHDLAGNVREWTSSVFKLYPYDPRDGREQQDSIGFRVARGGSWRENAWFARTTCRHDREPPKFGYRNLGFRLLLAPPGS